MGKKFVTIRQAATGRGKKKGGAAAAAHRAAARPGFEKIQSLELCRHRRPGPPASTCRFKRWVRCRTLRDMLPSRFRGSAARRPGPVPPSSQAHRRHPRRTRQPSGPGTYHNPAHLSRVKCTALRPPLTGVPACDGGRIGGDARPLGRSVPTIHQ